MFLTLSHFGAASGGGTSPFEAGTFGGEIVVAERAEPKTFNPVIAGDGPSRDIIRRMMGDLISINRETHQTEPGLANSWTVSKDGLHYTLTLRDGLRFSDGHPFDSDDVVFSFAVYLDEKIGSPQRDLLIIGDKPIQVTRLDSRRVRFDLVRPYAAAERIFDSLAMLPKHLLEKTWKEGRFAQAWNIGTVPDIIAGMGPFRLREYKPGQQIVLERNPWYWKHDAGGRQLPYLDSIRFVFVASEEAQALRFVAGETSILNRFSARQIPLLSLPLVKDLGASLEYNFLFFNMGSQAKPWFQNPQFRQAVSAAIDRESIVRLVFGGRATSLATHVSPANKLWLNTKIPVAARSLDRARELLTNGGFRWNADGQLLDARGRRVEFSLITSSGNEDRMQMATIVQEDLRQIGMDVRVTGLEFRSLLDRVLQTHQYDACILSLGGGDSDPNAEMNVWLSSGGTHLWNPGQKQPATAWEAQIDALMRRQEITLDPTERKALFDMVQAIEAEQQPLISLVSPNLLVAAQKNIGNFRPSVLDHYTLWNAEYLFVRGGASK
jgi:peptide/nickel transport system substrate-binding protein